MRIPLRFGLMVLTAVLACGALHACSNSILRNATEAGIETVLENPLPTPTAAVPSRRAGY